jgi:hypothetical protein
MRSRLFAILACVVIFSASCQPKTQASSDIALQYSEDEISFSLVLSHQTTVDLSTKLNDTATFESIQEFLVSRSSKKIPFWEGSLAIAGILNSQQEIKDAAQTSTTDTFVEIIGFKSNPIPIAQGALGNPDVPKYLNDFDAAANADLVDAILKLTAEHAISVRIN